LNLPTSGNSGPGAIAYAAAVAAGTHERDAAQLGAVDRLDELLGRLAATKSKPLRSRWLRRMTRAQRSPVTGLYLWGGVGRGKTWLMDLFYAALTSTRKRRVHFYRFMREVHRALRAHDGDRDPLPQIAAEIAAEVDVLCFDELFVTDIGDAMILGGLFAALFDRGVTLVATSNVPPSALYHDGLQRARFLPAIELLERHTEVFEIGGGTDYRLRALQRAALYHFPDDNAAAKRMIDGFRAIAGGDGDADSALEVDGRVIPARRVADGVAWFDFDAICDGPRGAADYIELARSFHTLFISGVPRLDAALDNQARRFITLVDECYDRRVKLVLSSAAALPELYSGKRLRFEFQRTASRLQEMQSTDYLSHPHLA
jgi:cell division protein ZapE